MSNFKNNFLLAAIILLTQWGCDKPESIPAYLKINPFSVNSTGGAAWQKITEGWVYVDGELLGGFTLPVTLPVLEEGEKKVEIFAGVKINGQETNPGSYLCLKRHTQTVSFVATDTITVNPVTSYVPDCYFVWPEDQTTFDGQSSIQLENRDGDGATGFEINTDAGFAGKGIEIKINKDHPLIEMATQSVPLNNSGGRDIWLEMQYRTDIPFSFLLLGDNDGFEEAISIYLFNPTENNGWNKIYFNLRDYVVALKKTNYRLFFRVPLPRDSNGAYSAESGTVHIDNLRLISF